MITRTMNPFTLRREMQKDIFDNIVPYLRRNYDSKNTQGNYQKPLLANDIQSYPLLQ